MKIGKKKIIFYIILEILLMGTRKYLAQLREYWTLPRLVNSIKRLAQS
jgi:hypothetical protein